MLEVDPGYRLYYRIRDIEPSKHIEITADEHKEIEHTLHYKDVLTRLKELNVTYGIKDKEIVKALESTTSNTYEIATGKEPIKGKDGWLEVYIDLDPKDGLAEDAHGKVDFRELKTIPTVEQGKIIATIHPPVPGTPGISVRNEPLSAKRAFPIIVKAENGAIIVEDKVVATETGRPFIEQRGQLYKISVMPKLVHDGDVDLSSGNIRFKGDVEIRGNVEENMVVEAGGDIIALQSINHSQITTLKSIICYGNVIGSELSAGNEAEGRFSCFIRAKKEAREPSPCFLPSYLGASSIAERIASIRLLSSAMFFACDIKGSSVIDGCTDYSTF